MTKDSILFWNDVALEAARRDFVPVAPNTEVSPEQPGPTRTSRALAIVHLAMYDAWAGVLGLARYVSPQPLPPNSGTVPTARAAVSTAACITLTRLFPRQKTYFLERHAAYIASLGGAAAEIDSGLLLGQTVAIAMLDARENDGSKTGDDLYAPSTEAGRHRGDPLAVTQGFLGPHWGRVQPFGVENLVQAVPGLEPPALTSTKYAQHFNEVKSLGRDTSTARTPGQTRIGIFWAYDGANEIGVPPRLYNQVVRAISRAKNASEEDNARLFAMCNVAMADAGIQCWAAKYRYNLWRPVLGIREAEPGTGPSGRGDGNDETHGDQHWRPLGAPRTNQRNVFGRTPGFPAYPSGHATFGAACLKAVQTFYGGEDVAFKFVSDEYDGKNVDSDGSVRTRIEADLTIGKAIEENSVSRVYLGVHWRFDADEGERAGAIIGEAIAKCFPARATVAASARRR